MYGVHWAVLTTGSDHLETLPCDKVKDPDLSVRTATDRPQVETLHRQDLPVLFSQEITWLNVHSHEER